MTTTTIGSYLKDLRLKKGYSLERLSAESKISITILKKIESDDLKSLPNITYVKGYIQNCLKVLHIPFDKNTFEIIDHTYKQHGIHLEAAKAITSNDVNTSLSKRPNAIVYNIESFKSKKIVLSVLVIVSTIAIFQFIKKVNNEDSSRFSAIPKATDNAATANQNIANQLNPKAKEEMPTISNGQTAMPTTTVANMTATPTAVPSATSTASAGGLFPYVEFKKINNIAVNIDPSAPENKDFQLYSEEDRKKIVPDKENVFITSLEGESWISYKRDDETPRSTLLKKDQKLLLAASKLFINIGNTKSIRIFHNGQFVKFTENKGVKSFIFPLTEAKLHSLPLFARDPQGKIYFYSDYQPLMGPKPTEPASSTSEQPKPAPQN